MIEYIFTTGKFNNLNKLELRLLHELKRKCKYLIIGTLNNENLHSLKHYCHDVFILDNKNPLLSINSYIKGTIKNIEVPKSQKNIPKNIIFYFHNYNSKLISSQFKNTFYCRKLIVKKIKLLPYIREIIDGNLYKIKVDWVVGWMNPSLISSYKGNIQRIRDHNELLYCLKSIYKYAPWINKIFIILGGNSAPPVWYKKSNKIKLIRETFFYNPIQNNSETKKLYYANINELSEYFIAGDDDYLLGNYIYKKQFFRNNLPILNSVHMDYDGKAHIPIPWTKSSYIKAINAMPEEKFKFYKNMGTKRENPWIFIKEFFINNKLGVLGNKKNPDIWIYGRNLNNYINLFSYIKNFHPQFICINDDFDKKNKFVYNQQVKDLNNFYKSFLPGKYPFQKF
tara:strand:+ start:4715 stop:5902 length:1188 start_codon:yes stop_codon:yes gene_type:complete